MFLLCLVSYAAIHYTARLGDTEIAQIVEKIDGDPNINPNQEIAKYISNSIKIDMSREQVKQALETIGTVKVKIGEVKTIGTLEGKSVCDRIFLRFGTFSGYWPIIACYDNQGRLFNMITDDPDLPILEIH